MVLNNVNSNADILTPPFLAKVKALADIFRPYGIRVYLSARFNAPMAIGGLPTADPLDPRVRAWWRAKADEIYRLIPDFGGFLVKANSEGQPGPQDFGRTHADGANMLADAVAPHGGIVMWRAFVYSSAAGTDRAAQAYDEFHPLDGAFRDNVIVQVKNGPIDFQPREPFSPLFGAMPQTPLAIELQLTKEYLGFATHLAYLGTMWEEVLDADTYANGEGSTVARVVDGSLHRYRHTAMAGVANIGNVRNWTGSQFDQANWYAFGRLAWNPGASARDIAEEWTRMTWGNDPALVEPIVGMMMGSRQAVVDYMTPLGLAHLMATGHHYGPGPWISDLGRPDWNPVYYHRADARRHRLRPHAGRHQLDRAICRAGARALGQSRDGGRRLPALVPPRAVGPSPGERPDRLGRARHPLHRRRRRGRRDAPDLGRAGAADRCAAPCRGGRLPRHPGGRGAMVARRLDRLFPEPVAPAAARRDRGAGARPRLLSGDPDALCAGGFGVTIPARASLCTLACTRLVRGDR